MTNVLIFNDHLRYQMVLFTLYKNFFVEGYFLLHLFSDILDYFLLELEIKKKKYLYLI